MSNRLLRVNELLQREISAYLHRRYPSEAVAITITAADVTGDLREAKIYFAVVEGSGEPAKVGRWLKGRLHEIRAMVAKNVVMRHVPLLTFVHDNAGKRALRIEQLLDEIGHKEQRGGA